MIQEGLGAFRSLKGRFVVLNLLRDVILVDDTYNANPESLRAALESLSTLIDERTRLIVGLGEMMELGESTREAHVEAGRRVARLNPQLFLAMGEHAVQMIDGAVQGGLPESRGQVVHSHQEMAMRIKGEMEEGALIFVKGSRKMALERVIDDLKKEAA
jgi:UDP-N-acetylmuramyl pentapeptide synthase